MTDAVGAVLLRRVVIIHVLSVIVCFGLIGRWITGFNVLALAGSLVAVELPVGVYQYVKSYRSLLALLWVAHGCACVVAAGGAFIAANFLTPSDSVNMVALLLGASLLSYHCVVFLYSVSILVRRNAVLHDRVIATCFVVTSVVLFAAAFAEERWD